jgi:hypothetical protein
MISDERRILILQNEQEINMVNLETGERTLISLVKKDAQDGGKLFGAVMIDKIIFEGEEDKW